MHTIAPHTIGARDRILNARERLDEMVTGIENIDGHELMRRRHRVINERAIRGIHSDRTSRVRSFRISPEHSPRILWLEQVRRRTRDLRAHLPKRRDVVENPEATTMRCGDEVAVLDRKVVHGNDREIPTKRLPVCSVVEADPHAPFGARIQESLPHWILAYHAHELGGRKSSIDPRPRLSEIGRLPDVRSHVLELISIRGDVRRSMREVTRLEARDTREVTKLLRRDVAPGHSAVARKMQQPIIRARPQLSLHQRRLREREDRRVILGGGLI